MVNFPKEVKTYCNKCKNHQKWKVSQYKKGKDSLYAQGKRRYDRKQSGFGGQTKPVFHKKAKVIPNSCVCPGGGGVGVPVVLGGGRWFVRYLWDTCFMGDTCFVASSACWRWEGQGGGR